MITAGELSAIFPHHLLKPPAQFFVKPRVIGEQKQIGLAHLRHIPAQVFHHPPGQAFPSKSGLHIHGAHIWGQIRPGVKIVFNDPYSPGDFPAGKATARHFLPFKKMQPKRNCFGCTCFKLR